MSKLAYTPRPLTLALIVAICSMLFLLGRRVTEATQTQMLLATAAEEPPHLTDRLTPPQRLLNSAALQSDPLFYPTRRSYVPPPPAAAPAAPPRPDFKLVGTFVVPRMPTIALLLENATGTLRKVKPGDDLNGWRVQAVETRRVILAYASESLELTDPVRPPGSGLQLAPLSRSSPSPSPLRPRRPVSVPASAASLNGPPRS